MTTAGGEEPVALISAANAMVGYVEGVLEAVTMQTDLVEAKMTAAKGLTRFHEVYVPRLLRSVQPAGDAKLTAELLADLKVQYGMVGTRDVDVAAWNAKLDRAIAALSAADADRATGAQIAAATTALHSLLVRWHDATASRAQAGHLVVEVLAALQGKKP